MQGEEMRAIRKAIGLTTQDALALDLALSRKAINEMETGKAPIERRTELALQALALRHALGHEVFDALVARYNSN